MTHCHRLFFAFLITIISFSLSVPSALAVNGVPHLPQDYNKSVLDWWNTHPYNPDTTAGNYIPVGSITHSGPEVDVCSQSGSNGKEKIKNALNKLPSSGGTLKFRKACSPYNLGTAKEWIESGYPQDFFWVNGGVNLEITNRPNLHFVGDEPGVIIQGSMHIQNTHSGCGDAPSRNYYFKNLTFKEPGNKHIAIIFENLEDILFDNVTFQRAGITSVIKGNNIFFRDSYFNNGSIQWDGSQFSGVVNSRAEVDFENTSRMYSYPYFIDFHQNNDGSCDADGNGKVDVYEERIPRYIALDGNQISQRNGSAPVTVGSVRELVVQSNTIQGPFTDFVKIIADNRPNPHTGKYYSYYNYAFISNTIDDSGNLFNFNISKTDKGATFAKGGVTVAYNTATDVNELVRGSTGSNYINCENSVNGSQEGGTCPNDLDPGGPAPSTSPTPTPTALPGLSSILTDFSVNSSKNYQWDNISSNQWLYTDRNYKVTSLPSQYQGGYFLKTANDDKQVSASNDVISFKAATDITVYVAYTTVNTQITNWLAGWNTSNPSIQTDLIGGESTRYVASKDFSTGQTVTLKGNGGTNSSTSMYNVIVKTGSNGGGGGGGNPTNGLVGDINQDCVVNLSDYSLLANNFFSTNPTPATADLNNDGVVNLTDFSILASNFFGACDSGGGTNDDLRTFNELPSNIKSQLSTLTLKNTADISNSPFGTHTTVLKEKHEVSNLNNFLGLLSETGYKWVKDYVGAGNVSSSNSPSSYWNTFPDWYYDYFEETKRLGFKVMIRIDFPRVDGDIPTSSNDMQYVREYYKKVTQEFGQYVDDWEIDNEPNWGNRTPAVTEAEYENIAAVAAQAIREGDPGAKVYGPATAMLQAMTDSPRPYIPNVINEGLLNHIDVFSFHPYRQPYRADNFPEHASEFEPWTIWGTYSNQLADLRTMVNNKPLATTEVGYPTHFNRNTDERDISLLTQAKYEQRSMMMDYTLNVRPTINFIFKRPFQNTTGDNKYELEYHFNIIDPDNSKKPIFYAVQNLNAVVDDELQKTPFNVTCSGNTSDLQIYSYTRSQSAYDELVILIWDAVEAQDNNHQRGTCTMTVNSDAYEGFAFYDLLGQGPTANQLNFTDNGSTVTIQNVPVQDSPGLVRGIRIK